jgi:hypothetical protein
MSNTGSPSVYSNAAGDQQKTLTPMSAEDIESSITNFAAGYCDKTIKVFVDGKRNAVSSYRMLSGITNGDNEDDVGKNCMVISDPWLILLVIILRLPLKTIMI